ncbi:hypothetical protein E2C01_090989 [Portunus trituberculatus]|uniref:Uncharacterized protein n=1 Tax=Portunus trituberculatus TaxID=210409 RepID=A0A5B7JMU6_PORTR|nr:hypothetical protein [Portunus trituberculatus]
MEGRRKSGNKAVGGVAESSIDHGSAAAAASRRAQGHNRDRGRQYSLLKRCARQALCEDIKKIPLYDAWRREGEREKKSRGGEKWKGRVETQVVSVIVANHSSLFRPLHSAPSLSSVPPARLLPRAVPKPRPFTPTNGPYSV